MNLQLYEVLFLIYVNKLLITVDSFIKNKIAYIKVILV